MRERSSFVALLGLCVVQASTAASSVVKVPFTSTLVSNFAAFYNPNAPLNNAALKVVAPVQAGNNQTWQNVLVDTGSAILWVGGNTEKYVPGPNTHVMGQTFSVGYGVGGVNGTAYTDSVTIGEVTAAAQIIGAAGYMSGFALEKPIDGILGLGPSGSNTHQVSGYNSTPTFVESLVSQGTIEHPVFGIYLGRITFGGVDESRISERTLQFHWEFNSSSFSFGDNATVSGPIYTRTDTGVLGIEIPFDAAISWMRHPGVHTDSSSSLEGMLIFPANMSGSLPDLTVGIADLTISIPPAKYTVPPSLYASLNITPDDAIHTWVGSGGPSFINLGQKFLESAYSAYDMVGFANLA
ncbi:acid protease [Amylocystis lapponica]|nr:acid protease [Amylocystis lapponica]